MSVQLCVWIDGAAGVSDCADSGCVLGRGQVAVDAEGDACCMIAVMV